MKPLVFAFALLMTCFSFGSELIEGEWILSSMIHQGKEIPLPNPQLFISWTFFKNGTERLYWDRGGLEFCERFASYQWDQDVLMEKTFAVNPKNAVECSKDPDMQVGKETKTPMRIVSGRLHLQFQLGDQELVYVLSRRQTKIVQSEFVSEKNNKLSHLVSQTL